MNTCMFSLEDVTKINVYLEQRRGEMVIEEPHWFFRLCRLILKVPVRRIHVFAISKTWLFVFKLTSFKQVFISLTLFVRMK